MTRTVVPVRGVGGACSGSRRVHHQVAARATASWAVNFAELVEDVAKAMSEPFIVDSKGEPDGNGWPEMGGFQRWQK